MPRNKRKVDPIPETFKDEKHAAAFWEKHSVADYWDEMEEAHFTIDIDKSSKTIPLERAVALQLARLSRSKRVPVDVLVNHLLKEILAQKYRSQFAE
jgi:hypothetical protein